MLGSASRTTPLVSCPRRRGVPSLVTPAPWQTASLLIGQGAPTQAAEPHGVAVMLERDMAAGRSAKAGQRLKLALGYQRCQGGALQGIGYDQHSIEPLFHVAGPDHGASRMEAADRSEHRPPR